VVRAASVSLAAELESLRERSTMAGKQEVRHWAQDFGWRRLALGF
jgi:hypothetical protein